MTDLDKLIRHRLGTRIMTGSEKRAIERVLDICKELEVVSSGDAYTANRIRDDIAQELRVHEDSVLDVRNG